MERMFYISCTFIFCFISLNEDKFLGLFKIHDFIVHVFVATHELLYKQDGTEKLGSEHMFTSSYIQ